jgi:RNA polymerase sigma factor (sigma-70 family)
MRSGEVLDGVVRQLRRQLGDAPTDGELLARFADLRDEGAFEALVRRHGGLVFGVAGRQLGDRQSAEDVFQATFLALARQARRLGRPVSLVNWLYTVALRQARKARLADMRRTARHNRLTPAAASTDPLSEITARELVAVIDDELARLPETYRLPLLLCAIEGLSREEAAARLGWSPGAVKGRLERGREMLRTRLEARGLAVPAVMASLLATDAYAVPAAVIAATNRAAVAALTAPAAWGSLKLLTAFAAMLTGVGTVALVAQASREHERPEFEAPQPPVAHAPGSPDAAPRVDREGVPLPPGVMARMGSSRMRPAGAIDLSPDGRLVAGIGSSGLRIWDTTTGKLVRRLDGGCGFRPAVRFSVDGQQVLHTTQTKDGPITFLRRDYATGRELLRVELGSASVVDAVVISPSARRIAVSGQRSKEVRVYDTDTGKEIQRLAFTGPRAFGLGISHDDRSLAIADCRDEMDIYDLPTGQRTAALKDPGKQFCMASFAPDGQMLCTLTEWREGRQVSLWDVATGTPRHRPAVSNPVLDFNGFTFSPDGKAIAIGSLSARLTLFDTATGRELRRCQGATQILSTAYSRDGRTIAGLTNFGTIALWETQSGTLLPASADPVTEVRNVWFADDGRRLIGVGVSGPAVAWDGVTGRELRRASELPQTEEFQKLSPDERTVAGVTPEGAIHVGDAATGQVRLTLRGDKPFVPYAVHFSPDARKLFATDRDRVIWIWDLADGRPLHRLTGHNNYADVLAVSPDGRWLASASSYPDFGDDFSVRLWDMATYREVRRLQLRAGSVWDIAFSPDSSRIAAVGGPKGRGSDHGEVKVWDVASGTETRGFGGHAGRTSAVAFSPDGRTLATGSDDTTVRLWEVRTGGERDRFTGHARTIDSLAFAPDSKTLAAASSEAPVYLWEVFTRAAAKSLTVADAEQAWVDLLAADAKVGFRAVRRLIAAPESAVALLKPRLKPAAAPDLRRVHDLIRQLDSPRFAERQKAANELEKLADQAVTALHAALQGETAAEVRQTLQRLLDRIEAGTPETLRAIRTVEVLEHIATPVAREHLKTLAGGQPGAEPTVAAAAALKRLEKRP